MDITPDTAVVEPNETHRDDPQQTGSGSANAPGGSNAPTQNAHDMTQGQEGYPGPRTGGEENRPGETPAAGDTDPAGTSSAESTGQDGDWSADRSDPGKNTANPWNG